MSTFITIAAFELSASLSPGESRTIQVPAINSVTGIILPFGNILRLALMATYFSSMRRALLSFVLLTRTNHSFGGRKI